MGFVHRLTNVKWRPVKLPFEELNQFVLQNLHLIGVPKFLVIAGKFSVGHNPVKEEVDKELHLNVAAKLFVKVGIFVRVYSNPRVYGLDITNFLDA